MECSSNILEALLRNYWNLAKDQHLLLSIHTLLMQKQFSHRELLKNYFPLKYSLNVPWMSKTLQLRGNTQQIFPEYCVPAGLYVSTSFRRSFKVKRTRLINSLKVVLSVSKNSIQSLAIPSIPAIRR